MIVAMLIITLTAMGDVAPPTVHAGNDELHAYLMEAAQNHPELQAKYETWKAKMERVPQVKSLDDPMFTYGQFLQSDLNRFKVAFAQKFPWFGTLRDRGNKAAAEADAALSDFYNTRNRIFANVKQAYFNYAYLKDQLDVIDSELKLYKFIEDTTRSRYALGLARDDELRDAQIRLSEEQDRRSHVLDYRPALSAQLAETLGRVSGDVLPWPKSAKLPSAPPPAPVVVARVRTINPSIKAYDSLIHSAEMGIKLAKKAGYPNFTLGVDFTSVSKPRQIRPDRPYPASLNAARNLYRTATGQMPYDRVQTAINGYALGTTDEPMAYSNGGDDNIMVSLTMTLPIWRKKVHAGIAEAKYKEQSVERMRERQAQKLGAAARMAIYQWKDAKRREKLYKDDLIPQAQLAYQSLQSSYSTGLLPEVTDVLDAIDRTLQFGLEERKAVRDMQNAAAQLEYLMGGSWETGEAANKETGAKKESAPAKAAPPKEIEATGAGK